MPNSLAVGQKLGLLLTIALVALGFTLIPFTVDRLDEARAARTTSTTAQTARDVGRLVQEVQQEQLLALSFLLSPAVQRTAVLEQMRVVDDSVEQLRSDSGDRSAELTAALDRFASLDGVRDRTLGRRQSPSSLEESYGGVVEALIGALRLTSAAQLDAWGRVQLDAVDSLLRANAAASRSGVSMLLALGGGASAAVVEDVEAQRVYEARFRLVAAPEQMTLLDAVQRSATGRRIGALTDAVRAEPRGSRLTVADALPTTVSYVNLRRILHDRIVGEVAAQAQRRAAAARSTSAAATAVALLLVLSVVLLNVKVYRSIARPLRRLTRAASMVAELAGNELARVADQERDDAQTPRLAAVDIRASDEIGELATAFNRVQATAALLLDRQVTTRRNVSLMFANVAQRTRTLVSRQLMHIDDLESNEQDPAVLEKLYRLDHLTNRLRRGASSLMVVSGRRESVGTAEPQLLADVVRAALGEIESFQVVRLGRLPDTVVSADLVGDLRLLLAELLENATAASPPGVPVDVSGEAAEDCQITLIDRGIGMSPERMAQENARLLRRERLDIAPTSTLGLFVVGRLARRHGLDVHLTPTPGGGVTAVVVVPKDRLRRRTWDAGLPLSPIREGDERVTVPLAPRVPPTVVPASLPMSLPMPMLSSTADTSFTWFPGGSKPEGDAASAGSDSVPEAAPTTTVLAAAPAAPVRAVARAVPDPPAISPPASPSTHHPPVNTAPADPPEAVLPRRQPDTPVTSAPPIARAGLTRRVPGAHLEKSLSEELAGTGPGPDARPPMQRDPEAERVVYDEWSAGLVRAQRAGPPDAGR
jgi:signal transduction histidine kinase